MKRSLVLLTLLVSFWALFSGQALACWGFRPMGMGGTFVAVADDANAAYWNRAGFAQLKGFKAGQSELVFTTSVYNFGGFFARKARVGNPYYDSINYANKLDENMGWGISAAWNGGASFDFSPGFGFRLPDFGIKLLKNQSLGIGYFLWNQETYITSGGANIEANILRHQLHLDYLWRPVKEFSFGVHIERFWEFAYNINVPSTGQSESGSMGILEKANVRPSIAWWVSPDWIVNAGVYDIFSSGGGPFFAFGSEYNWKQMSFRGGVYNIGGQINIGLITAGFGYRLDKDLELGSWLGVPLADAAPDKWMVSLGAAWRY